VTHTVAWPYITLKVRGDDGVVLRAFYAGAPVPANADPEDLARLVRKGAITGPARSAAVEAAEEPVVEAPERPKDYAAKGEWVDYAVARRGEGVSEDDARAAADAKPKADLIAEFGG
jgi:hypothetical protein